MVRFIDESSLPSQIVTSTRLVRADGESGNIIFSSLRNVSKSRCRLSRGLVDKSCYFEVDLEP